MAVKLKVTYLDGREETVLVSPRAQVNAERHFHGTPEEKQIELSYYLAWESLRKARKEDRNFESFIDAISDVEQVDDKPSGPTDEEPSPDTSSP